MVYDHTVGLGAALHTLGQIFQVDLMHDAGGGRHHAEVVEGLLAPAQKFIALVVALELQRHVVEQRLIGAVLVHLHTVVDHEVHRNERVDLLRIAAKRHHRGAHGRQVHHGRHAGEVLQNDAGGLERYFDFRVHGLPAGHAVHVFLAHVVVVGLAQHALQQHAHRNRQIVDLVAFLFQLVEAVVVHLLA
jgi:hypothetical protein